MACNGTCHPKVSNRLESFAFDSLKYHLYIVTQRVYCNPVDDNDWMFSYAIGQRDALMRSVERIFWAGHKFRRSRADKSNLSGIPKSPKSGVGGGQINGLAATKINQHR